MTPKIGLTLPSFTRDVDEVCAIVHAAEDAGLDGVFLYDHLFRVAPDGTHRPALESTALLGAVIAASTRIHVGTLVERASLRPPAITALTMATVQRAANGRFIGGIGAGDEESEAENEHFGVPFGTVADRVDHLRAAVRAARDQGFPVWVGGLHREVRDIAVEDADGWNRWGGDADRFASQAADVIPRAVRPDFVCSWGGLVVMDRDDAAAQAKAERLHARPGTIVGGPATISDAFGRYVDAGAGWVIAGPIDSRNPENAAVLADVRARLVD